MRTYRELAEDYGRQGQSQMRDRFLVLAADAALAAGQENEAELLRGRLLKHNPHHLLKPYRSFAEAMKAADVQNYVFGLRRSHPHDKAEILLDGLRRDAKFGPGTRKQPPAADEEVKVLRVNDRTEKPKDPAALANPSSLSNSPSVARPVRPAELKPVRQPTSPETVPLQREPYPDLRELRRANPPTEDHRPIAGAWVATGLFLLLLIMGIVLAVYTALRPFLPQEWFRF
jgi:hypothetical protein